MLNVCKQITSILLADDLQVRARIAHAARGWSRPTGKKLLASSIAPCSISCAATLPAVPPH